MGPTEVTDGWIEQRRRESAELEKPAQDKPPQYRSGVIKRKASEFMDNLVALAESTVTYRGVFKQWFDSGTTHGTDILELAGL